MSRPFYAVCSVMLVFLCVSCDERETPREKRIEIRNKDSNGILVGTPKVYDDSLLQMMLNSAQSRLVSLQMLDQTGIALRLGSITGANQQISSFGLSVQGPPIPQSVITSNGATNQVASTANASGTSTVTTNNAPVQNTQTTVPQFNGPTASAPAATTSLPSSFSVSASDILNEQMQLTYEIANLRLLLEGPLNDRIAKTEDGKTLIKPRITLGFPITINSDQRFRGAVAIVEVEVETLCTSYNNDPPAITALLPREKTYNVAAIKDRTTSIGAGVVTQVAGVSGSYLFGRKTYYVVQDQDTLALTFTPEKRNVRDEQRIGFSWEFRPVLGESYAKSGLKQTFVQLAFPTSASGESIGKIRIRSYWRKYDRNTGLLREIVGGSLREEESSSDIPTFNTSSDIALFGTSDAEDLGNGQMLVHLQGNFLGGTYVRVGSTILQAGSPGFTSEYSGIRFVAPLSDLATKKSVIVTRDGTEVPIVLGQCPYKSEFKLKRPDVVPIDETNSLIRIASPPGNADLCGPFIVIIGGKVFGYSDAPIFRDPPRTPTILSVIVPTGFLIANPELTVRPLMADDRYFGKTMVFDPAAESERLAIVSQDGHSVRYLLYGRDLNDIRVLSPTSVKLELVGTETGSVVRSFELPADTAKSQKVLILVHKDGRPSLVPFPALASADGAKQDPKFQERVTVGADEAVITGDDLSKVVKVMYQKQELGMDKSPDGKSIKVKGLVAAGVTVIAKTQDIDLMTASGKTTLKLEVVNSKVENVTK